MKLLRDSAHQTWLYVLQLYLGGLDSQVGSVVRQSAKGPGSIPGGAEVLGTDGICKYLPVPVSSYVEVCLCLLCSVSN